MLQKKKLYIAVSLIVILFIFRNSILVYIINIAGSYLMNSEVKTEKARFLTDPFRLKLENTVIMNLPKYGSDTKVIESTDFIVEIEPGISFSKLYIPHVYGNQVNIFLTIKDGKNNLKHLIDNIKMPLDVYLDSLEVTNTTLSIDLNNQNDKKLLSLHVDRFDIGTSKPGEIPIKKDSLYKSLLLEGIFEIPENLTERLK